MNDSSPASELEDELKNHRRQSLFNLKISNHQLKVIRIHERA